MMWYEILGLIIGGTLALLGVGMPVGFALAAVTLLGILFTQGWGNPFMQYVASVKSSLSVFTLLPVPLFVLMGEILWHSQIAGRALKALDMLLGRLPGRLSLLAIASGTLFSTLSGSTMANTALLGRLLVPELKARGYSGVMSMGPIMASGALAMLIPPSALAVIFASVAKVSIGKLLLALIVPGLLLAVLYAVFVVGVALRYPKLAPAYDIEKVPFSVTAKALLIDVVPLLFVIITVVGVIFQGVATPTEAAAVGALASLILAAAYGGLSVLKVSKALMDTLRITVMMLTILASAIAFSQLLAFTGASRGLLEYVLSGDQTALIFIAMTMLMILVLGMFLEQIAIMMITLPILMPIVAALSIDPLWFSVLMLINLEIALMTPPFGMLLFVMGSVTDDQTSMSMIWRAALPYVLINVAVIALIMFVPAIATLLPNAALG
ncbi:TRAP transporter large permease [Paenalcaligenes niemegkensis]|uniref:TRAP transporter large permease n=1 Tax=Paenalcaligenes niemegkensis TaxID=2895469 RepID=UPI001EE97CD2|nr:TRAP transporter large permease [Paenalcaligenes niemegkensis]MCQ9618280.1 TRAP transporter large permease [Paenalcaligenes niemegkensis]